MGHIGPAVTGHLGTYLKTASLLLPSPAREPLAALGASGRLEGFCLHARHRLQCQRDEHGAHILVFWGLADMRREAPTDLRAAHQM